MNRLFPIPAPGYRLISGKRNPPANDGGYWVQLRNGLCDLNAPWPARGPRWIWDDTPHVGDVVAVKPEKAA